MNDWIGLLFIVVLAVGAYLGLRALSKPVRRTEEEFERNAAESTSPLGASMNVLQEMLNPEAAKAKEVQTQLKEGRYNKREREGKATGDDRDDENVNADRKTGAGEWSPEG